MENTLEKIEIGLTQDQQNAAESKRKPWGDLGVRIYELDLELQARAQQAIASLIIPTKIEDVVKAEALLKEVKAKGVLIANDRKSATTPLNNRMSELMLPEKSFEEPCKKVEAAIIAIKKADQGRQRNENLKLDALKNCREWLTTTRNNTDASFKNKILKKVGIVYEHALGKGDVAMDMLAEFIEMAAGRMHPVDFEIAYPLNTFSLVSSEQFQSMCVELLTFDANIYLADYKNQLQLKFSDYAVALGNKVQALAIAKQEAETKAATIASNVINSNVAAKLETIAITPVVSIGVKALKQVWVVDMPETIESVIIIMTAFTAHINLCLPKLNVSKWFSFTPSQAAISLSKVKNDDESFTPHGIIFRSEDKLK